jgi:tripartite-type tricarboxylate transporter receptor subunit TctC
MPVAIVARNGIPARDLGEFVAYLKQHADEMTMAHAGMGSVSHVTCQLFNSLVGVSPKMRAFQGSGPAMTAVVDGKVDYLCDQAVAVVPTATAHLVHASAVGTPARVAALPDVPTAAEAGLPAFNVSAWNGLFAPKETPRPIVDRLNAALSAALDDPAVRKSLLDLGAEIAAPAERTPEALAALVRTEVAKWMPILTVAEGGR